MLAGGVFMRCFLVAVDLQNDFVTGVLGTADSPAAAASAERIIADFKGEVVFTRDTHERDYLSTQEGRRLPVSHCVKGSEGWRLCPEVSRFSEGKKIFDKPAFGSLELADYLISENAKARIDCVTLIGVCTDICVISNALIIKAALPECRVAVIRSACAGATREGHERALAAMRACQIDILD